jgi:hypothetical protein
LIVFIWIFLFSFLVFLFEVIMRAGDVEMLVE